jgi:membrane associated rhomboid family serine protease
MGDRTPQPAEGEGQQRETQPESGGGPASRSAPSCFRHPDRETYIRCAHCDRPICPDCMSSASVGFQCPECIREGRRTTREPRTVLGGRVTSQAQASQVLIGLNAIVFLLATLGGQAFEARLYLVGKAGFTDAIAGTSGVAHGEWYRLLTATFLHVAPFHLLANMYSLWVIGQPLEALLGRGRFVALYLLCGLGGSAASYALAPPISASLGASGAVFGLAGAMIVIGRRLNYDLRAFLVVLAINLAIPLFLPGIDWRAHLGGLVTGLTLGYVLAYAPAQRRRQAHVAGCVAMFVLLLAVVLVRTLAVS